MPATNPDRLLMVYNAEDGLFNALTDWAHKIFSPSTYECPLCRHTYGVRGMLMPWKTFLERQPFRTEFLYRPDFRTKYPQFKDVALPLILVEKGEDLDVLALADEIQETNNLEGLIRLVETKLENPPPAGSNADPAGPKT